MGSSNLRLLNHSTHSKVAYSTASRFLHGPRIKGARLPWHYLKPDAMRVRRMAVQRKRSEERLRTGATPPGAPGRTTERRDSAVPNSGDLPVFNHQRRDAGEFRGVVGNQHRPMGEGDRCDWALRWAPKYSSALTTAQSTRSSRLAAAMREAICGLRPRRNSMQVFVSSR